MEKTPPKDEHYPELELQTQVNRLKKGVERKLQNSKKLLLSYINSRADDEEARSEFIGLFVSGFRQMARDSARYVFPDELNWRKLVPRDVENQRVKALETPELIQASDHLKKVARVDPKYGIIMDEIRRRNRHKSAGVEELNVDSRNDELIEEFMAPAKEAALAYIDALEAAKRKYNQENPMEIMPEAEHKTYFTIEFKKDVTTEDPIPDGILYQLNLGSYQDRFIKEINKHFEQIVPDEATRELIREDRRYLSAVEVLRRQFWLANQKLEVDEDMVNYKANLVVSTIEAINNERQSMGGMERWLNDLTARINKVLKD